VERVELVRSLLERQLLDRLQLVGQLVERKLLEWLELERIKLVCRSLARSELGLITGRRTKRDRYHPPGKYRPGLGVLDPDVGLHLRESRPTTRRTSLYPARAVA
jgi:hypothetical protein